jgi:hypothetical protein
LDETTYDREEAGHALMVPQRSAVNLELARDQADGIFAEDSRPEWRWLLHDQMGSDLLSDRARTANEP